MKKSHKTDKHEKGMVASVSYIHDPNAAKLWFSIYVDMVKNEVVKQAAQKKD
ncbi:hypothetical protein [Desulfuribacillus alkaliarsenatis]|uniref:hypothetical protein n=1 Tax=Desulfuribacillus alkaliarsenatis TaxID=766136 RepID=UPI0015B692AC|nr:hypothetical protein [Desulfuribacillus alkaliarsenatis]